MNYDIIPGSLTAISKQENKSIAETFINADCIVIVDTSGSMASRDSQGGRSRYEVACDELKQLQATHPGKIAVLAFSNETIFCPSGVPLYLSGGTDMTKALQFAKIADVPGMQFILISDGEPDDPAKTLSIAQTYLNKISTIYVGPEENPTRRKFLEQLSQVTGGKTTTADRAKELKATIERLMLTAG